MKTVAEVYLIRLYKLHSLFQCALGVFGQVFSPTSHHLTHICEVYVVIKCVYSIENKNKSEG